METPNHIITRARIAFLSDTFDTLLSTTPETLGSFAKRYPTGHGVYVITDPDDNEIVYVGRSISARDGLGQRIYDHIYNSESSDLNQKLGGDRELTKRHLIRIVELPDFDIRRFAEHFGIAILQPKLNR